MKGRKYDVDRTDEGRRLINVMNETGQGQQHYAKVIFKLVKAK
jgi:hypothetical protein